MDPLGIGQLSVDDPSLLKLFKILKPKVIALIDLFCLIVETSIVAVAACLFTKMSELLCHLQSHKVLFIS